MVSGQLILTERRQLLRKGAKLRCCLLFRCLRLLLHIIGKFPPPTLTLRNILRCLPALRWLKHRFRQLDQPAGQHRYRHRERHAGKIHHRLPPSARIASATCFFC